MEKKKLFELTIDEEDELSGIESISLVDEPAIEISWLAFKKDKHTHEEDKFVPEGQDQDYLDKLFEGGQPEQELLDEGWVISDIELVTKENFALIPTQPNEESYEDTEDTRIRYKYDLNPEIKGPKLIPTSRLYCQTLINKNFVWRREELMGLPGNRDKTDGGFGGNPMIWRGGYNCRHFWWKITYKKEGRIINKGSIKKNRKGMDGLGGLVPNELPSWNQPSTITSKTRRNPSPSSRRNLGLSKDYKFQIKVENEEKHILLGPAMLPEKEIIRADENGDPYYVYFTAETIRMVAEKYMKNGFNTSNDINHDERKNKNVYVVESWIKEDENDKSVKYGFEELPIGTWFISMKVKDDKIWEQVKSGELNGFSVAGTFIQEAVEMQEQLFVEELAKILGLVRK